MKTDTITAAIATLTNARQDIQRKIDDCVKSELDYKSKIDTLRELPTSLDDFSQYLKKHIEAYANTWFAGRNALNMLHTRTGETALNKKGWRNFEPVVGDVTANEFLLPELCKLNHGDAFGALCFAMPDAMHEKLMTAYRAAIGDRWGNEDVPSVEQRRASIADMNLKMFDIRVQLDGLQKSMQELSGGFGGDGAAPESDTASARFGGAVATVEVKALKGQRLANPDLV